MRTIAYILLLILFMCAITCSGQKRLLYDRLNSIRVAQGKTKLHRSYWLELKSKVWLIRMDHRYGKQVHSHRLGGEVLAQDSYDPLASWMDSKPHRRILMSDQRRIGVAIYRNYACGKLR